MSHPVRIGVQIQPQHASWKQHRQAFVDAEELGADVIFNWDHFYPLYGEPEGKHFEAYTSLAALAEVTEKAKIGSLVTCNSYRNPHLLADMARTIDQISDGRFILGIGSGWFEKDYNEYEYEFGTAPSRLQDLKRDLPKIRERLGKLNPPPVQEHLPILIGGSGPRVTLRLVAEHADIWHAFGSPQEMAEKGRILDRHCADVGRNPAEIERSADAGDASSDPDAYLAEGFTFLVVGVNGPDYDFGRLRELIQWRDNLK